MRMSFPSCEERTVASALLILSNTIPHQSPKSIKQRSSYKIEDEEEESLSSKSHSLSSSSSSTLTSVNGSSSQMNCSYELRNVAVVSRCQDMKFKVVRKKRSKVSWSSFDDDDHRKLVLSLPATASFKSESSTEEVSCISSSISSVASSARIETQNNRPRRSSGPSKMSCKAKAILKMLSSGWCFSEVKIREALGDSPDTSKALRMLLKQEEVIRSGIGGRVDPYIYKIA